MTSLFANSLQALVETPSVVPSGPSRSSVTSAPTEFGAALKAHLAKQDARRQDDSAGMIDGSVSPAPRSVSEAEARASTLGDGSFGTVSPPRTKTEPSGSSRRPEHEAREEKHSGDRISSAVRRRTTSGDSRGISESDTQASQRLSPKGKAEAKTSLISELTATDPAKPRAITSEPSAISQGVRGQQIGTKSASMNSGVSKETPKTSGNAENSDPVKNTNREMTAARQNRAGLDAVPGRESDSRPLKSRSASSQENTTPSEKHGDVTPEIRLSGKRVMSHSQDTSITNQRTQPPSQQTKQGHLKTHTSDKNGQADISEMGQVRSDIQKGQSSVRVATRLNASGQIVDSSIRLTDAVFSDATAGSASRSIARDATASISSESSSPKVTDSRESPHGLSATSRQETTDSERTAADTGQRNSDKGNSWSWSKFPAQTQEWTVQNLETDFQPLLQSRLSLKTEQIHELRALVQQVIRSSQALRLDNGSGLRFSWTSNEWGPIRFSIGQLDQRIVARVQVPNYEVKTLLEGHRDLLRQVFAEQGLQLDRFEVESATDAKSLPIPDVRWDEPRRRRGRSKASMEPPRLQVDAGDRIERASRRDRQTVGHVWIA
jgi:hypothetical protein